MFGCIKYMFKVIVMGALFIALNAQAGPNTFHLNLVNEANSETNFETIQQRCAVKSDKKLHCKGVLVDIWSKIPYEIKKMRYLADGSSRLKREYKRIKRDGLCDAKSPQDFMKTLTEVEGTEDKKKKLMGSDETRATMRNFSSFKRFCKTGGFEDFEKMIGETWGSKQSTCDLNIYDRDLTFTKKGNKWIFEETISGDDNCKYLDSYTFKPDQSRWNKYTKAPEWMYEHQITIATLGLDEQCKEDMKLRNLGITRYVVDDSKSPLQCSFVKP